MTLFTRTFRLISLIAVAVLLTFSACQPALEPTPGVNQTVDEQPVTVIPLADPLDDRDAQVSGLAWYGDDLIILPQYPDFDGDAGDGVVFALPRAEILAFLDGDTENHLAPFPVQFVAPGLDEVDGFEGYEAIVFSEGTEGNDAFLTIEAETDSARGYLVHGMMAPDLSALRLDPDSLVSIEPQSSAENKAEEAAFVAGDRVVTIYEVNGAALNPSPVAHVFDEGLNHLEMIPFPSIEYRVTDATALDEANRFWIINYFYPGEAYLEAPVDPIVQAYGIGSTHARHPYIERLVEMQYTEAGITLAGTPPLQLALLEEDARNWEGVVRLGDRGFLLITDMHPDTILGFVAAPAS